MLGWIAAGGLNPASWSAFLIRGMPEFNYTIWAWHIAVPLEFGLPFRPAVRDAVHPPRAGSVFAASRA
jgi:hypothetical protein